MKAQTQRGKGFEGDAQVQVVFVCFLYTLSTHLFVAIQKNICHTLYLRTLNTYTYEGLRQLLIKVSHTYLYVAHSLDWFLCPWC
jgi:hypothetical protein